MTKEQLSSLSDTVRIPAELLIQRLLSTPTLSVKSTALSEEGGIAFFFEEEKDGLKITADIEIHPEGEVSASVIPFIQGPDGWDVFQSEDEPIDLWDVEEEPPFEETISLICQRFGLVDSN